MSNLHTTSSLTALHITAPLQNLFALHEGFSVFITPPNALANAQAATEFAATTTCQAVSVPSALAAHVQHAEHLDNLDHWLCTQFAHPAQEAKRCLLRLDGLLTHAEVYLNGQLILQSTNAFHTHETDVTNALRAQNTLWICFRAIAPIYSAKQPRARYMTRLINQRHLRFIRTPVLGYTAGFSSPAKPVGAYRPIRLIALNRFQVQSASIKTDLIAHNIGKADVDLQLEIFGKPPQTATLAMVDNEKICAQTALTLSVEDNLIRLQGSLSHTVEAYWPHTHGEPKRYALRIIFDDGETLDLGLHGFKRAARASHTPFTLLWNDEALFLRGACWTPINPLSLYSDAQTLRARLQMLKEAGFNLLRMPGNMLYESDDFYALCDEFGMLVVQDFMFTNFDYPGTEDFFANVNTEATQFLQKHGWRPCLALLCGGSEVAQQAAMMGLPLSQIKHTLFTEFLPNLVQTHAPHLPYVASSPYASQGMPFHVHDSVNTYFGVGGYLRSFEDARLCKSRFITECLPFSHVPEDASLRVFWGGEIPPTHTPTWKEGVTRDTGSGWDFSDVTDHYLQQLFGLDPVRLRATNPERYLAYCRATVAAAVETTMSIFRADSSLGRAVLVWLLHDLKPGAGWGYIDSLGQPKSAFYALAHVFQPTSVLFVDEGLEGLAVYAVHDSAAPVQAHLEISLINENGELFAQGQTAITLNARSVQRLSVDTVIGYFVDSSYAYRFGSRAFVACVARLTDLNGKLLSQRVYAPTSEMNTLCNDAGLQVHAKALGEDIYELSISCAAPAYFVSIELPEFNLSQNYFHVMPSFAQTVIAKAKQPATALQGRLRALNVKASTAVSFK